MTGAKQQPVAKHLPSTATAEAVVAQLRAEGYAIVDDLVPTALMDRITAEMDPYIQRSLHGDDNFVGKLTKRTGMMIARSPAARELIMNPLAIGTAGQFLAHASTFQLHLTQVISVFPGSKAQPLHRDQVAWDFFPFPKDYEVQCNLLWAMSDYTAEMGATRVVPGSQFEPDREYTLEESIPAEMRRGSALFYTGKVYHGAGENKSDKIRQAINITYAVGWVRQEENQFLATPLEIARTLPEDLLKVMGYQMGCFAMGYVGDFEDPMNVIKEPEVRRVFNVELMQKRSTDARDASMLMRAAAGE
jgi:ectoine hydroxylase-related dioxygenase (phytanoyl-CoA dioxygenase family)